MANIIYNPDSTGSDLFLLKLLYEDPSFLNNLTNESQYNGNISGMICNKRNGSDQSDTLKIPYAFLYDGINRISTTYQGEGNCRHLFGIRQTLKGIDH
jgi:hypothetical protein